MISLHVIEHWIALYGYGALFLLLLLGIVGLPVPDETLLAFSGYLVSRGDFSALAALLAGSLGAAGGITTSYLLGRIGGLELVIRHGGRFGLRKAELRRTTDWFESSGKWVLPVGYFVPGVRHLTALAAGIAQLDYPTFARFAYAGALIWSGVFLFAGYLLGGGWSRISTLSWYAAAAGGVVLLVSALALWLRRQSLTAAIRAVIGRRRNSG